MVQDWALVALGGALGALLRFAVTEQVGSSTSPWGTLTVNLVGSLALGALSAALALSVVSEGQALLFGTGLLGAFTTMSTFSMDTVRLAQEGAYTNAVGYVVATAAIGPLLAWVGWKVTHAGLS
jgi:CrcB protein